MKHACIFLLPVLCSAICFSQNTAYNKRDSSIISDPKSATYVLYADEKSTLSTRLPFAAVTFADVRYDTTFVAINWQANAGGKAGRTFKKKLNLADGVAAGLTAYVNDFYKSNFSPGGSELVCFIKEFSITLKNSLANDRYLRVNSGKVNVELECFYKSGNLLIPAIRVDTSYEQVNSRINKTFPQLVKEMIHPFLDKLARLDTASILKRKSYPENDIQKRYYGRFNIPILTSEHFTKGVYRTFDEFKNNAPSITNFTVKDIYRFGDNTRFNLLYDSANNIINTLEIFGFCDGTTCWIQHGDHCFPLVRVDHSFEYLYYIFPNSNGPSRPPSLIDRISPFKFLLAVNMENGKAE